MTAPAISVDGVWKEFVIGGHQQTGQTFREAIMDTLASPLRRIAGRGYDISTDDRFWALRDVSFKVEPGEVVGIIGRNGAGKSTLLKVLSRITAPTKGRVEIRGRIASLLEVGTGFHPELTGRENIRLNGAILGMSGTEIRAKFDEIVAFSGVEKFIDTPVKRYSSGMQVRLAFAVAAHLEPEILLVDEVLAVGDAEFQKKCLGKMSEIASGGGRTVLFVSHQLGMVARLCPRAIMLSGGEIAFVGTGEETIDHYVSSTRTAAAVGAADDPRLEGKDAVVTGVDIVTSGEETSDQVSWHLPFTIRVRVRIRRPLGSLLLGVAVDSQHGGRVTTWTEQLSKHVPDDQEYAEFHLEVPPNIVAPGGYSITAALIEPHLNIQHMVEGEWPFTIIDTGSEMAAYAGVHYGVVIIPATWSGRVLS